MSNSPAPKVSVIIPVYQSEEHIHETIKCLQEQTLHDLEFLFIDDKGGDSTFNIVRKAAEEDSRIVLLENEVNSGPGICRNKGIKSARGEYIAFVDADDLLSPDFYEKLYAKAKETGALAVKSSVVNIMEDGKHIKSPRNNWIKQWLKGNPGSMLNLWYCEHWAGIYSRELIIQTGAINCETARRDQDTCFQMMAMIHVKPEQFAMEESVTYYYVQHEASLVHKPKDEFYMEQMRLSAEFKINFMMQHLTSKENASYIADIIKGRLTYVLDAVQDSCIDEKYLTKYISYFAEVLKQWRASGQYYIDTEASALLRKLHYHPTVYYATRKQFSEISEVITQLQKRISSYEAAELNKRYRTIQYKLLFAFGKRRKKLKEKKKEIKNRLSIIKQM